MERFEIVVDDEGNYCGLIPSENGPLVQLTDAQATIAALQARVQELEDGTSALLNQQSERLAVENEKLTMALSQLTQRTVERDTARRRVDELEAREVDVVTLREDLEQRTAELERVSLLSSHNERRFEEVDKKYKELREQNRVLWEAAQQAMDLIHEDIVQGDKAGRRLKAEAILWNALTATIQEGQHESR